MTSEAAAAEVMHSTPVYQSVAEVAASGARHLLVSQAMNLNEATELYRKLSADGTPPQHLFLDEKHGYGGERALECLAIRLRSLLSSAAVGTRLYVCGDESFLWQVHRIACAGGLQSNEITMIRSGQRRDLYCVHCSTHQKIGHQEQVRCSGCGVQLLVREHFSRRLGAYMGVCSDPEQPWEEAS